MRYIYRRFSPLNVTLSGSQGAPEFVTDVRLDNGHPYEQTVVTGWPESPTDETEYLDLTLDWGTPEDIGVIALLAMGRPQSSSGAMDGLRIEAWGRPLGGGSYSIDLGGNTQSQRSVICSTGETRWVGVPGPADTQFVGARLRIFNDRNGSVFSPTPRDLYLGEVIVGKGVYLRDKFKRTLSRPSNDRVERGHDGSIVRFRRPNFRSGEWEISGSMAETMTGSESWARLRTLSDDPNYRAFIIPRGEGDYGQAPDYDLIQETAMMVSPRWGDIEEEKGGKFHAQVKLRAEEVSR